jgi:hypothetical protein
MMQEGYAQQWGPDGRDDLGTIKSLGSNAVLLQHSFGTESKHDHGKFLDRAFDYGLHVLPGYHTANSCTNFDCFDSWKKATVAGFGIGFKKGNCWHPAVGMLVLAQQPDQLNFEGSSGVDMCKDKPKNKCWVRAVLSMIDGVLAAEKEQGITNASVNMTAAWSMDTQATIDGKFEQAIGYFGWYDLKLGIQNPHRYAGYHPRTSQEELAAAYESRWTNAMNLGGSTDWSFISNQIQPIYAQFEPNPWFLQSDRALICY